MTSHIARSEAVDPLIGRLVENRYQVQRCIGRGGMGSVYLAEHVRIRRKVAIKVLHGPVAAAPGVVARFHREAVAAAAVGNEHVVAVTDMGQLESGAYYIVLEYLQGTDLSWRVAHSGPLSVGASLHVALQLCEALAAVHAAGIVHRDLKPENLFLCERAGDAEFLKVLDFGVCKMQLDGRASQHPLTGTGAALGTPHYMAPEQIEGRSDIDQRADIYAVGGIMYFMLAGDPPFDAPVLPRLFSRICTEPCPSLLGVRADVPSQLEAIVQRCLAKRPQERYASASQLRSELLLLSAAYPYVPTGSRPDRASSGTLIRAGVGEPALHATVEDDMTGYVPTQVSVPALASAPASGHSELREVPGKRRWPLRTTLTILGVLAVTLIAAAAQRSAISHTQSAQSRPYNTVATVPQVARATEPSVLGAEPAHTEAHSSLATQAGSVSATRAHRSRVPSGRASAQSIAAARSGHDPKLTAGLEPGAPTGDAIASQPGAAHRQQTAPAAFVAPVQDVPEYQPSSRSIIPMSTVRP